MTQISTPPTIQSLYENIQLHRISVQDFFVFALAASRKSASIAAQEMEISQPAVSYALDKLRYAFKDDLLVRTGNQMQLTERGSNLLRLIHEMRERLDQFAAPGDFDPSSSDREFHLAGPGAVFLAQTRNVVQRISKHAPNVKLVFHNSVVLNLDEKLAGSMDLQIDVASHESDTILCRRLSESEPVVFYDPTIRAAPKTIDAYLKGPHMAIGLPSTTIRVIDSKLQQLGYEARAIRCFCQSVGDMGALVRGTDMLATFLKDAHSAYFPHLARAPLPFNLLNDGCLVHWHITKSNDPGLMWLIDQFAMLPT